MLCYGKVLYNIVLYICYTLLRDYLKQVNIDIFAAEPIIYGSHKLIKCENGLKKGIELDRAEESTR